MLLPSIWGKCPNYDIYLPGRAFHGFIPLQCVLQSPPNGHGCPIRQAVWQGSEVLFSPQFCGDYREASGRMERDPRGLLFSLLLLNAGGDGRSRYLREGESIWVRQVW